MKPFTEVTAGSDIQSATASVREVSLYIEHVEADKRSLETRKAELLEAQRKITESINETVSEIAFADDQLALARDHMGRIYHKYYAPADKSLSDRPAPRLSVAATE